MQISVQCRCGKTFATGSENVGKRARCPTCGNALTITAMNFAADELLTPLDAARSQPHSTAVPPPPIAAGMRRAVNTNLPQPSRTHATLSNDGETDDDGGSNSNNLTGLFDWKFRHFITPVIVSFLYTVCLILAVLALTALVVANYWLLFKSEARGEPYFYFMLIALDLTALLFVFGWILVIRLSLESVMVIFRGEEHLRVLVTNARENDG
jgi:uncharacterized membrane protein YhaH (DUF805 family)